MQNAVQGQADVADIVEFVAVLSPGSRAKLLAAINEARKPGSKVL